MFLISTGAQIVGAGGFHFIKWLTCSLRLLGLSRELKPSHHNLSAQETGNKSVSWCLGGQKHVILLLFYFFALCLEKKTRTSDPFSLLFSTLQSPCLRWHFGTALFSLRLHLNSDCLASCKLRKRLTVWSLFLYKHLHCSSVPYSEAIGTATIFNNKGLTK